MKEKENLKEKKEVKKEEKKATTKKAEKKSTKKKEEKTIEQKREELFKPEPKKEKETKKTENKTKTSPKEEAKFKQVKNQETKGFKTKEKENPKNIKTKVIIGSILLVAILIFSSIFAIINLGNSNILKGVTIKGIDVSGLSKEDAKNKIDQIYNDKKSKEIEVKYQDYESAIDLNAIEANFDTEKAVEEAVKIGKDGNIFVNNYKILKTYLFKKDVNVDVTVNDEITNQTIEDIGAKLPGIVVESSYYIEDEDDELIVGKGTKGIVINNEEMKNKLFDELNKTEVTQEMIEIPVKEKEPDPIDIDKIHEEIYTEVQDAYYTKDPFEVHPEVEGIDFNVEEAKTILQEEGKEEYVIPLIITKPKVTIDQLGTEIFPDRLATFTTKYDASNADRTTNLRLACQKLNGKVVLPGETFSYNKTLGERTVANGYRNGKIYENGEVVDGIGGGICQISSTLYNTVLMANLDVVERRNHMFVPSYLPAGRDATVVYGSTDFKFKNTRKYPVRITASVSNGIATVAMYGIKEDEEYTISFNTKTISTIPPTTKYEEDPSVPSGTEKVKQAGSNGLVTETYIIKTLNGKVVSSKLLSRDTYSAMQKVIVRGTGAGTAPATPSAPAETTPSTPTAPATPQETPTEPTTPTDPETQTDPKEQ